MESVAIPLVPQWNIIGGCTVTPDGGFLYIGHKSVSYVSKIEDGKTPTMKAFHTRQRIKSIDCDPDWSSTKYFVVLADDNSIQVWDFDECKAVKGHRAHIKPMMDDGYGQNLETVKLCFLKSNSIISMDSTSQVLYCVASNTYSRQNRIIPVKYELSILKPSPYEENILAVGTTKGLIIIVDLEAESILYTLKGHDSEITSLSWMLVKPLMLPEEFQRRQEAGDDEIFNIYEYDYLENEFGVSFQPPASAGVVPEAVEGVYNVEPEQIIADYEVQQNTLGNENFNFVEACQDLKDDILARNASSDIGNGSGGRVLEETTSNQVTLKDCEQVEKYHSSSCSESYQSMDLPSQSETNSKEEDEMCTESNVYPEDKSQKLRNVYLASGSHESVIWIWNTKTGSSAGKIQLKAASQNIFIDCCWLNSSTLLSNTRSGDLVMFTISNIEQNKLNFKQCKQIFPQRGVVSISKLKDADLIWTISTYREIVCASMKENRIIAKYSCASTNIAAIRERPDDMNKLAFACADHRIGLINLSNVTPTNIDIENFSSKIDAIVLDLAWSPDDSHLAFGTSEGRVGVLDTDKPTGVPVSMNPFSGKPVYSLDWYDRHIFVCSNEKIAVYDWKNKSRDPKLLTNIYCASAVSVKGLVLLVGTQAGEIEVYKRKETSSLDFKFKSSIQIASKYISEISWSRIKPLYVAISSLGSPVAVARLTPEDTLELDRLLQTNAGDTCVKWSNKSENLLLSCGFDGAVRVWDLSIDSPDPICLKQFHCPMLCGIFSPLNENIVICAGKATSIEMFDIRTEQYTKLNKTLWKKIKDKPLENIQWAVKIKTNTGKNTAKERRRPRRERRNNGNDLNDIENMMNQLTTSSDMELKATLQSKNQSTILHLSAKEVNKDAIQTLTSILEDGADNPKKEDEDKKSRKQILSIKLFGSKEDILELLKDELNNYSTLNSKSIGVVLIPQIAGDLKEEILNCIKNKRLTEWHLSLAPSISFDFWKNCSLAYATQLIEQGQILQAVPYLLACHDIKEAINQLINKKLFREAWIIAKLYREPDDPINNTLLEKWINNLDSNGNLEGAALICALSGRFKQAHELISKRRNPNEDQMKIIDLLSKRL